jgi:hypothetical protein
MVGLNETIEMLPKLPIHRIQSVVLKVIRHNGKMGEPEKPAT